MSKLILTTLVAWNLAAASLPVTVVLAFDRPHSSQSLAAMEREAASLMKSSGIRLEWKLQSELPPQKSFHDVLVIKMKGNCAMDSIAMPIDERGPLGTAYVSDGEVLSFGAVECDRVRSSVNRVGLRHKDEDREALLGRALGRVVAHEMYHMLSHKANHTEYGVTRSGLSADELTSNQLLIDEPAVQAIKQNRR